MSLLLILLLVVLAVSVCGGVWGHSRWGYASWSPLGVLLLILVVLYLTGNLHHMRIR